MKMMTFAGHICLLLYSKIIAKYGLFEEWLIVKYSDKLAQGTVCEPTHFRNKNYNWVLSIKKGDSERVALSVSNRLSYML